MFIGIGYGKIDTGDITGFIWPDSADGKSAPLRPHSGEQARRARPEGARE